MFATIPFTLGLMNDNISKSEIHTQVGITQIPPE